jgi:hypothetical protein
MKCIFLILGISILFFSCQENDDYPYQSFSSSDYQYIPQQYKEIGKVFTFINNQNDTVKIRPKWYDLEKKFNSSWDLIVNTSQKESYYYDELWISLEILDNGNNGDCNFISINIYKTAEGSLVADLSLPFYDEIGCLGSGFEEESPFQNLAEMVINDIQYSKVKVVNPNDYFTPYKDAKIDKVYYDMDNGIVGFDDTENALKFKLISN